MTWHTQSESVAGVAEAEEIEEIEVLPGVAGPKRFATAERLVTHKGHEVSAVIAFDQDLRRYVCEEVRVFRSAAVDPPAEPVTTDALRWVPVAMMMKAALLVNYGGPHTYQLRDLPNPDGREPWGRRLPADLPRRPTDRVLAWVAQIYRLGHLLGEAPTKAVQEDFGLSRTTAIRWIMAARDKGYLGAAETGKAGG